MLSQEATFTRLYAPIAEKIKNLNQELETLAQNIEAEEAAPKLLDFPPMAMLYVRHSAFLLGGVQLRGHLGLHSSSEDSSLVEARRDLDKALRCFEQLYESSILASFHDNLQRFELLADYPELTRYQHLRILGLVLELVQKAKSSRDLRWQIGIAELLNRHAVLLRNSAVIQGMNDSLGKNNQLARERRSYLELALMVLRERSEANRARYESSRNSSDMLTAIRFCSGLIPLLTVLRKETEAQEFKKRLELWERLLNEHTKKKDG